ncbi:hypothetical protein HX049_17430 [Myroides odoratimimus]|uniref:hypothetical protein n=1 Tax=Myroides odoratimimus TaxID=76832 RepID=UPI002576C3C0|nr:hypothetical protein [Myroides odoratimimus]MDM1398923.1 hypothetical protein [Myroides odoratimimus]
MRKYISLLMLFYSLFSMAQVGIGVENPQAAVHIGKEVKFKDIHNVETEMIDYPQHLIADEKGNLAVFTGLPTNLMFKNVLTSKMLTKKYIPNEDTVDRNAIYEEVSLGFNTKIIIPAKKTYVLEVNYSIPSMHTNGGNSKGEFGVFLKKKQGDGDFEKITSSVRSFSESHSIANSATAIGRAIAYTYVDTVSNDTDSPLELVYDVYGFTDHINLHNYSIVFGAFDDRIGYKNYNWGRGMILVTVNELIK